MSRAEDKQRMKEIFDELARGNGAPFLDAMADDFCWTIIGTTSWSGFYRGKEAVRADLLAAVARWIRRSIHQHGADGLPRSPDDGYQSSQAAARIVATGLSERLWRRVIDSFSEVFKVLNEPATGGIAQEILIQDGSSLNLEFVQASQKVQQAGLAFYLDHRDSQAIEVRATERLVVTPTPR